jgi:hypothetical protein
MTPEEEAYEEARRRHEAEKTGALELDLSWLALHRLPPEVERLTSLQSLNLSGCLELSGDLTPLVYRLLNSFNNRDWWPLPRLYVFC